MSTRNGDKSRFHRERKQKIRKRTCELMKPEASPGKSRATPTGARIKAVSA